MNMLAKFSHSPDDFMFRSFDLHSRVFKNGKLDDYFMISSGTNQFPMPQIWKDSMAKELETDFLYRWYTDSRDFQCITSAIKIYEDYISGHSPQSFTISRRKVCMTTGGCGAAYTVFDYLSSRFPQCKVILVGMNYSLYERIAKKYRLAVYEMKSADSSSSLPKCDDFKTLQPFAQKEIFVFSVPNNPTGESYSAKDFAEIVTELKARKSFIILDLVCNLPVSEYPSPFFESIITSQNYWGACVVINSFSKTDSVAGLRIGYIYGEESLITACATLNANTIMNPPTFPAFAIVLTCLFRCIYLSEHFGAVSLKEKFKKLFRRLFFITSAGIPLQMRKYAQNIFSDAEACYKNYVDEQLKNERDMATNYKSTLEILNPQILKVSKIVGGFNFCVWFKKKFHMDELSLIWKLIDSTGVAVLTESSFSLAPAAENSFFVRFSTACDSVQYRAALYRLKNFLSEEGFTFDKHDD